MLEGNSILTEAEERVWALLGDEPRHVDDITEAAQMPAGEVNACLCMLELKGVARRLAGALLLREKEA